MRLIVLGPPGAGKGTQAHLLKEKYGIPHISTGEMFRRAIRSGTELGRIAQRLIDKGQLVPDEITIAVVAQRIQEEDCRGGFILDGFPRTLSQAHQSETIWEELAAPLTAVLHLSLTPEEILERLIQRRVCSGCGATYNLDALPPAVEGVCDRCGAQLILRPDDEEETIRHRIEIYKAVTEPLVAYYQERGTLLSFNGGLGIPTVFDQICCSLEERRSRG